jgi:putative resolvase
MKVSISNAAKEMGFAIETLHRWEAAGKIEVERTPAGIAATTSPRCASKVSVHAQRHLRAQRRAVRESPVTIKKSDLLTQVALLESYCAANGWSDEVLQDLGSGLNYHKRGLQLLIKRTCSGEVGRWVLTHQDRQPAESRKPISASTPASGEHTSGYTSQGNHDTGENQVSDRA